MADDAEDVELEAPTVHRGVFEFDDGARYEGEFVEGEGGRRLRQGQGSLRHGPEEMTGEWDNDLLHGHAKVTFASGAVYEGGFDHGVFCGTGVYSWPDGSFYQGGWRSNKMHGDGCYRDARGLEWRGHFHNGKYDNGRDFVSG